MSQPWADHLETAAKIWAACAALFAGVWSVYRWLRRYSERQEALIAAVVVLLDAARSDINFAADDVDEQDVIEHRATLERRLEEASERLCQLQRRQKRGVAR